MKTKPARKGLRLATAALFLVCQLFPNLLQANPVHGVVAQGTATITSQGSVVTVQTGGNALINWNSFNIGVGETTRFIQPNANSVVWNRINDPNPSQILGNIYANGLVVLQNTSGFFVGGQAAIRTHGLIMTTSPYVPNLDIAGGGAWQFNALPPTANIINYGQIEAGPGGPVYLIAHGIENHGVITASDGKIGLYAGKEVWVSSRPDGLALSAKVKLPDGSVDNTGSLIADGGTISLQAKVVNQGGPIQANSVREQNGVVEIIAGDELNLAATSVIQANGDAKGVSDGGSVTLKSGNTFRDEATSIISVTGGANGGNGGVVEISAADMRSINSVIDGHAVEGFQGGHLLIDPTTIRIGNTGTGSIGSGTVSSGSTPGTLNLNVNSAFTGFSKIDLQATGDITLLDNTTWDLATSTGITAAGSLLTLEAGGNINIGTSKGANIFGGTGWSVTLEAGRDFSVANTVVPGVPNSAATGTVKSGTGNVLLAGTGTVQTLDGSISVLAGNGITVNTGAIRTVGGGTIDARAVGGSINTGKNVNGYLFSTTGYTVSGNLGGISTGAGGDVTITAGGDVTSFLPTTTSSSPTDAGSGAFGATPGVVTVTAGGNVYGHFVAADSVRNGAIVFSTITAQNGDVGAAGNLVALSLVKGGWTVHAPHGNIYLQEVRNPNGVFNGKTSGASPFKHLFDYDLGALVDLEAGDSVNLEGTLLPRYTGDAVPVIYPPTLTINAGAGGVTMENSLTLFPSAKGELTVNTINGGSLEGGGFTLAMSDSSASAWSTAGNFANDHAATPVQLNNANPVVFNIAGNMNNVTLISPKETEITVKGNMNNTSFSGQNLHVTDQTTIDVTGKIFNQSTYSFVTLGGNGLAAPAPRFPNDHPGFLQLLQDAVVPGSGPASANGGALLPNLGLFYLPGTHQLGYFGKMDSTTEQALLGTLHVKTYLLNGQVALDDNGNYITKTITFGADHAMVAALYTASQNAIDQKDAPLGFQIGGPGQFNITAQAMDLGVSGGLISEGPAVNAALAKIANRGAAINLTLDGDLNLFASQISSYYGGGINIDVGGKINAGIQDLPFGVQFVPHGIWTSGRQSDVSVIATGDIDVAGSRIAAFDGGNVFVESRQGNVDAGKGDFSEVKVNEVIVGPRYTVTTPQQPLAGSGILATTLPDSPISLQVGNITVLTPHGNINASLSGISQEPLNGNTSLTPTLTLTAGTRDAQGNIVYPGNISAGNSGVIGVNTILNAAGNISGLVVARGNSTINAAANVSGTFLAGGSATFNASGTISGIAIAGGALSVGSGSFQGVALSQNVSGGGAQTALATQASVSTGSQSAAASETTATKSDVVTKTAPADDTDKSAAKPVLAKYTGRVTVILPPKTQ